MPTFTLVSPEVIDARAFYRMPIEEALEREWLFSISSFKGKVLVAFNKGDWNIHFVGNTPFVVSDNGHVKGEGFNAIFCRDRLEYHLRDLAGTRLINRTAPARAITDIIEIALGLSSADETIMEVVQPGRNGTIKDGVIIPVRRDW